MEPEPEKKYPNFSNEETYDLLRIKAIQNIEKEVESKIISGIKSWGAGIGIAVGIAAFLGFTSIWGLISSNIQESVNEEVSSKVENRLLKFENKIDQLTESSILARNENERVVSLRCRVP